EYARRRAAALAEQQAALAEALSSKLDELAARARSLRAKPLPDPPPDRPSLRVSFIPLTQDLPEDPAVRALLARHHEAVGRDNLEAARSEARPCPPPAPGAAAFIGTEEAPHGGVSSCKGCHPEAVAQWETTKHARAWATLVKGGREHDLDCVACHVTGWKQPGGACSVAATEGRRDVQCEACHGPASLHAFDPPGHIVRAPGEERCRACHTPEHSTRFEVASFLRGVIGPGHGDGLRGRTGPP
ncbi:MAG TPA: cytochrome c family protein, partial [Anaeromyxobacteraceae bacterium]